MAWSSPTTSMARSCGASAACRCRLRRRSAWDGMLYVGTGSQGDANRPFMAVKPGASGDITLKPGDDQQRVHRLAAAAGRRLHAVGARPRRQGLSGPRHRHPHRARREVGQADLQGARRRRRPHFFRLAGRVRLACLLPDRRRGQLRARHGRRIQGSARRTTSARWRLPRRPSPATRCTSGPSPSSTRSATK